MPSILWDDDGLVVVALGIKVVLGSSILLALTFSFASCPSKVREGALAANELLPRERALASGTILNPLTSGELES